MAVAFNSLGDTHTTQPPSCQRDHLLSKYFGPFGAFLILEIWLFWCSAISVSYDFRVPSVCLFSFLPLLKSISFNGLMFFSLLSKQDHRLIKSFQRINLVGVVLLITTRAIIHMPSSYKERCIMRPTTLSIRNRYVKPHPTVQNLKFLYNI